MSEPVLLLPPPRLVWTTQRSNITSLVVTSCDRFALSSSKHGVTFWARCGCGCSQWKAGLLRTTFARDALARAILDGLPQSWGPEVAAKLGEAWDAHWDLVLEDLEGWTPTPVHYLSAAELSA